jgi:tape measure protein
VAGFSATDRIRILLELKGAQAYVAKMRESAAATELLARRQREMAASQSTVRRNTFLQNQAMFTGRRLLFYSTLGTLGLAAAVTKLGFSYLNTMQQTRVALGPLFRDQPRQLNNLMNQLFRLAAYTPFTFQQVTQAFRAFYVGFSQIGISAQETLKTVSTTMDALSVGGFLTERAVRQVSNAMQDLAYQGTLTQRMVTRLSQLQIPIHQALTKELGLSADQMQNIGKLGIPAVTVIRALNKYASENPLFRQAALRLQTQTLFGAWTTLRDLISQAAGQAESGLFGGLQKTLQGIVLQLDAVSKAGKPVTFTQLARAIDSQLSPSTHTVMNLFILFEYALKTLITTLGLLLKSISLLLKPLDVIAGLFGANNFAAKLLGITMGILTAAFIVNRIAVYAWIIAVDGARAALWALVFVTRVLIGTEGLGTLSLIVRRFLATSMISAALSTGRFATVLRVLYKTLVLEGLFGMLKELPWALKTLTAGFSEAAAASWAFTASLLANPITWIVVAVAALTIGLVLLVTQVRAVNKWLRENYWWFSAIIMLVMGPLGLYVNAVITLSLYWRQITNAIRAAYGWMRRLVTLRWVPIVGGGGRGGGLFSRLFNIAKYTPLNPLLGPTVARAAIGRQVGGWASGWTMVGERGPEMVRLPASSRVFAAGQMPAMAGGHITITVVPQPIYFDRQKVAEVVARVVTDRKARW